MERSPEYLQQLKDQVRVYQLICDFIDGTNRTEAALAEFKELTGLLPKDLFLFVHAEYGAYVISLDYCAGVAKNK